MINLSKEQALTENDYYLFNYLFQWHKEENPYL